MPKQDKPKRDEHITFVLTAEMKAEILQMAARLYEGNASMLFRRVWTDWRKRQATR